MCAAQAECLGCVHALLDAKAAHCADWTGFARHVLMHSRRYPRNWHHSICSLLYVLQARFLKQRPSLSALLCQ